MKSETLTQLKKKGDLRYGVRKFPPSLTVCTLATVEPAASAPPTHPNTTSNSCAAHLPAHIQHAPLVDSFESDPDDRFGTAALETIGIGEPHLARLLDVRGSTTAFTVAHGNCSAAFASPYSVHSASNSNTHKPPRRARLAIRSVSKSKLGQNL